MGSHKCPYWVLFYFFIYKKDLYRNLIDAKSHFNTYNNANKTKMMGFVFWPGGKKIFMQCFWQFFTRMLFLCVENVGLIISCSFAICPWSGFCLV